jgi:hypothetical protein
MAFEHKPNTGTLWPNEKRTSENHPSMRGDVAIDVAFIEKLIENSTGPTVKVAISAWPKTLGGKECLSLAVAEPYVKQDTASTKPWEQ